MRGRPPRTRFSFRLLSRKFQAQLKLLSPLGERLGEGVMQETILCCTPSPNLSPKGERNMRGLPQRTCFSFRLLSLKFQAQASSSSPPWGRGWVRG